MGKLPKQGDKVAWDTAQGETQGVVEEVVTSTTKVKSHVAKASKDDPQVVVKSSKSGKKALHKPDAVHKR